MLMEALDSSRLRVKMKARLIVLMKALRGTLAIQEGFFIRIHRDEYGNIAD